MKLDEIILQLYFKRLMHTKGDLNRKLLSQMCTRFIIPSLLIKTTNDDLDAQVRTDGPIARNIES